MNHVKIWKQTEAILKRGESESSSDGFLVLISFQEKYRVLNAKSTTTRANNNKLNLLFVCFHHFHDLGSYILINLITKIVLTIEQHDPIKIILHACTQ